ncbi:cold and drought-regulated protein CORA-like [Harpegnathos saltator]|uniref:cold and drought-regulated protein CORA-like n=1 Tax=Harpegnathos saltator TaxID=610380 RepID=UPI00058C0110|nr:cold and drought-regulated protein CORA-like [Harpegnathos saltator]
MESVFNMMRPLHFVLLISAFAFFTFSSAVESKETNVNAEFEAPAAATNDLETDASAYWGYGRPYGGWYGGRGYYGGYPGYFRGGWGGRGYGGWGGRGYLGGWGGGYWG